jgi:NADH-quinone oxidoreductase subunit A
MLLDVLFTFTTLNDYFAIAIAIFFSLLISLVLFGLVTLLTYKQYDVEKTASFECGFHPFEDTREKFNIRFYLVSILFIIFDLEITYLFP